MNQNIEILPLTTLRLNEVLPIVTGYISDEKYAVTKSEDGDHTIFDIQLVKLDNPHQANFEQDFRGEDYARYVEMLVQGHSFGAYHHGKLVALAISEVNDWNRSLRIWEFQVMEDYRSRGIGRALMERVISKAVESKFRIIVLETQNTNVPAIRFYRRLGFTLEALDLSLYTNEDVESGEVAFIMKRKLESGENKKI
jgi:ribosomal protein S18 acetylase RimI-like enzyme